MAMAMRLAENTSNSVAVVEAGGFYKVDNGDTSVVPRLGQVYNQVTFAAAKSFPSVDWNFQTTPQTSAPVSPFRSEQRRTFHFWYDDWLEEGEPEKVRHQKGE